MNPFTSFMGMVEDSGVPFRLHQHEPSRTVEDAELTLSFEIERLAKTVAFRTRSGEILLAVLAGKRKVHYPSLAAVLGLNRRDLAPLSPEEVRTLLEVEPGSISPLLGTREGVTVIMDEDLLTISPTVYCGIGRPDRTLEVAPADLLKLSQGRLAQFSRQ